MMIRKCGTCRFWDTSVQRGNAERDTTGLCWQGLPTVDDRDGSARWPLPSYDDSCSHYRPDAYHDPLRPMTRPENDDDIPF